MTGLHLTCEGTILEAKVKTNSRTGYPWLFLKVNVMLNKNDAEIIEVAMFKGNANSLAKQLTEGVVVYIQGRAKLRRWEDENKNGICALAICAETLRPLTQPLVTSRAKKKKIKDPYAPIPFDDEIPM